MTIKKSRNVFSLTPKFLVILVAIGLFIGFIFNLNKSSNTTKSKIEQSNQESPAKMKKINSEAGGFEFNYPSAWGDPQLLIDDSSDVNNRSGVKYIYDFYDKNHDHMQIIVNSDDYSAVGQSDFGLIQISPVATKAMVLDKTHLFRENKADDVRVLNLETDFYSTINIKLQKGSTDSIEAYRIVSIPKINASAVYGQYSILTDIEQQHTCKKSDISPETTKDFCLTKKKADQLEATLASFKAI